jgi:hypothetical protein
VSYQFSGRSTALLITKASTVPERLATRAWGMSGPARIQEQNRTVPYVRSFFGRECCHKTQNCPVDSTSFAAGLFRSVYFVTFTRHFSIQDLYLWTDGLN